MQKIFVKEYIRRVLFSSIISLIVLSRFLYLVEVYGKWDGNLSLFMPILVFVYTVMYTTSCNVLPEYLYIAPLSFEERAMLVKRQIRNRNIALLTPVLIIGILPPFVYGFIHSIGSGTIWCLLVAVVIINIVNTTKYLPTAFKKSTFQYVMLISINIITFVFCSGLENFKFSEFNTNKADVILGCIIFIISVFEAIYYSAKYSKDLPRVCADYETVKSVKPVYLIAKGEND